MTQKASVDSIVAHWSGELTNGKLTYRLKRDGDRFLVDMPAYGTNGVADKDRVTREVVMTTGSTAAAAARILKQRGAGIVGVWALARTPPRGFLRHNAR